MIITKSKKKIEEETNASIDRSLSSRINNAGLVLYDAKYSPMDDFNSACEEFRTACSHVEEVFGIQNFKGGYDEIIQLKNWMIENGAQHEAVDLLQIMGVFMELIFANLYCVHEASKIGLYGVSWWNKCWENQN